MLLDGVVLDVLWVLTDTAELHLRAWTSLLDEILDPSRARFTRAGYERFGGWRLRGLEPVGVGRVAVSDSRNARAIVDAAGLTPLFDAVVDGVETLRGSTWAAKPAPDLFLEAAAQIRRPPRGALWLKTPSLVSEPVSTVVLVWWPGLIEVITAVATSTVLPISSFQLLRN